MKAILPILICSAITGALGYYFGHITIPTDNQASTTAPTAASSASSGTSAFDQAVEPMQTAPVASAPPQLAPAQPAPVAPSPTQSVAVESAPATETAPEVSTAPVEEPAPSDSEFASRAAQTSQTLTDKQGRTIQASIVKVLDTEVKIRRTDGLETTIPLNMLSDKDVAFCNYIREQQQAEEVKTPKTPDTSDGFDWDAYFNS